MNVLDKAKHLIIDKSTSILGALKRMDEHLVKALLILEGKQLLSLITIGDIQRAIIANKPFETAAFDVTRKELKIARDTDDIQVIKAQMLQDRIETMPVVDKTGKLVEVYMWQDLFDTTNTAVRRLPESIPVVIMAGGFGTRLKPLTNVIPKPLIPVGEKTILEVIVDKFDQIGVQQFYFNVNYKHEMIRFYFDGLVRNYDIEYILESQPLGTGGSLSLLKDKINTPFFISNCDIIVNADYTEIYNYHKEQKNDITIVASLKHFKIPYGTIESGENGELLSLIEKPEITYMINTGMYLLQNDVLEDIPDHTFIHITEIIEKRKAKGMKVGVFPVSEKSWIDIGEWPEFLKLINKQ